MVTKKGRIDINAGTKDGLRVAIEGVLNTTYPGIFTEYKSIDRDRYGKWHAYFEYVYNITEEENAALEAEYKKDKFDDYFDEEYR